MGISSATIEFTVHKQLHLLPLPIPSALGEWKDKQALHLQTFCPPLLFLALYHRACLSFLPPRLQFLCLSLGFCSVMWDLQRVGKSCSPFENHEGSRARGRRVKHGTSSLMANFAHCLDIMTTFGDFPPFRRAS